MAAITEDVKPTNLAGEILTIAHNQDSYKVDSTGVGIDIPDLATLEEDKKTVQRVVHEHESFWSWLCFRIICCDGYCPFYHCHYTPVNTCDCCIGCGDTECCGDCNCCGDCDCCANCGGDICQCCGDVCTGIDCGACFSSC